MDYEGLQALAFLFVIVLVYMFPAWIASLRHHHNRMAIAVLVFLTGWTVIGWIIALVWALTITKEQSSLSPQQGV